MHHSDATTTHAPRNPDNPEEEGEEGEGTSQGDNLVMRKMRMVRFLMLSSAVCVSFKTIGPHGPMRDGAFDEVLMCMNLTRLVYHSICVLWSYQQKYRSEVFRMVHSCMLTGPLFFGEHTYGPDIITLAWRSSFGVLLLTTQYVRAGAGAQGARG